MSTRNQQREKRIRNTELKRKLREDPTYREKEAQMARRRYKQKQEQLQALREQLRYQQELIHSSQQKIQSMTFRISELETAFNKASLEAATTKTNLEKLMMELEQTKTEMNRSCWDTFIERNLCSPLLTNLIKFNYQEFEELLEIVTPHLNSLNTRGSRRRRTSSRPEKVSVKAHLFITLFWLRQYPTDAAMACIFGLDRRKITRILRRTLTALHEALRDIVSWPTDAEFDAVKQKWNSRLPTFLKDIVAIVDGTEIKITRSSNSKMEKASYSVKKKQHSLTLLLICQPDGKIIYASDPLLGSSDQHHWNNLNLRDLFENKEYGIVGDSGFTFNHKDGNKNRNEIPIIGLTPNKKPKNRKLTRIQKKTK
jgi:hypothetical protein